MHKTIIAILAVPLLLSACATTYQSNGLTGGFREYAGPGKLEKVDFYGNGYITSATVQTFALYRCAEIAKSKNKPFFIIYEGLFSAAAGNPSQLPTVGTIGGKPVASAMLQVLDGPRPGALETEKVLRDLHDQVHSQQAQGK